jgi:hypothetical protein
MPHWLPSLPAIRRAAIYRQHHRKDRQWSQWGAGLPQRIPPMETTTMSDLVLPKSIGSASTNDIRLLGRALRERWPISDEQRARWLTVLDERINSGDDRTQVAALRVAVQMEGQNQKDQLGTAYIDAVGEAVQVLPLHEELRAMAATLPVLPAESIVDAEVVANDTFGAGILPSCSPPATPPPS